VLILRAYKNELMRLLQVADAEEKTAGGLFLTEATKEKPSIGTVSFHIVLYPHVLKN